MFNKKRKLAANADTRPTEVVGEFPNAGSRKTPREPAFKFGTVYIAQEGEYQCIIRNVNAIGAKLLLDGGESLPDEFLLAIGERTIPRPVKLAWATGNEAGVYFV